MKRFALACVLIAGLVGCDSSAPVHNAQIASELDVLREGLESWKGGGTPASLEASANSIQFVDPDWKAGAKLVEYRIVKLAGEEDGETVCNVTLKLDVKGKQTDRQVVYRVTSNPKWSVSRYPRG